MRDEKDYFDELDNTEHFQFEDSRRRAEDTNQFLFSDLQKEIKRTRQEVDYGEKVPRNTSRIRSERRNTIQKKHRIKEDTNKESKRGRENKKKGKAGKVILILVMVTLIIGAVGAGVVMAFLNGFNKNDIPTAVEPVDDVVNILLVGKDMGSLEDLNNDSIKRTDTIMLVNINPKNESVNVVSIPRDTLVTDEYGNNRKINSLYQDGIDVLKGQVESLLKVTVNYMVEVDYNAFRQFIDAIGGVEVTPEFDMIYDDNSQDLHIYFEGGKTVNLDGRAAEEFFRWRQNNGGVHGEKGDIGRIENQQKFLKEVFKKCASPEIVTKIPEIAKIMQDNISTNMNGKAIIKYATEIAGYSSGSIKTFHLKGVGKDLVNSIGQIENYWEVNPDENYEVIAALNPDLDPVELQKEGLRIVVLNATGIPGLAATMQNDLLSKGYKNVWADTAFSDIQTSSVEALDDTIATKLCEDTEIGEKVLELTPGYDYDVIITIGLDHKLAQGSGNNTTDTVN